MTGYQLVDQQTVFQYSRGAVLNGNRGIPLLRVWKLAVPRRFYRRDDGNSAL